MFYKEQNEKQTVPNKKKKKEEVWLSDKEALWTSKCIFSVCKFLNEFCVNIVYHKIDKKKCNYKTK